MRILLVDRDVGDRERVARVLRDAFEGCEVVAAGSAAAVDRALAAAAVDLVLTEADLGWTDGLTLLREVRARRPGVPVILVTGAGSEQLAVAGFRAGLADYVRKDALEDLVPAVRRARGAEEPPAGHVTREQLLRAVQVETVAVLFFDESGRIVDANDAFLRLGGYTRQDLESGALSRQKLIAPEFVALSRVETAKLQETGRMGPYEKQMLRKDGSRWWALFAGESQGDGTTVAYVIDITKRKRAEASLRRYADELEALNRANETLLQEVNHRVKNNLASILGLLYVEERRMRGEERACCASLLMGLRNRVRSLAAAHAMLSANQWQPLRAGALAGEVIKGVTSMVEDAQPVVVSVTPSRVRVTPDQAHHLALVLGELATNTVKHGRGTGPLRIEVQAEAVAEDVCVTYRDRGPGYPQDVLDEGRRSVGLGLVHTLVTHSLRGRWRARNDGGAVTEICFPAGAPPDSENGHSEDEG